VISWRGLPFIFICVGMVSLGSATDRILVDRLGPTQATLFISNADGGGASSLLRVRTIWMTEYLSGVTKFITLIPD